MRDSFDLRAIGDGKPVADSDFSETLVDYLFNSDKPRFLFDDLHHFSGAFYRQHLYADIMLPRVRHMLAAVIERVWEQTAQVLFPAESISSGRNACNLVKKYDKRIRSARTDYRPNPALRIVDPKGVLSTYRLNEVLDSAEVKYKIVEPNRNRATARLQVLQTAYPDKIIISPSGMESALQAMASGPEISNRQMFRDEDFEAFWIGVCYLSHQGVLADDVAFSRNGNFETFAFFQMRYGLVPFRPKADAGLIFPDGHTLTPAEYLKVIFAHMLEVVPQGIMTDMSTNMAMRMIMLEDMRVNGWKHPQWGKLDLSKVNPDLINLPPEHDKEFAALADQVVAFIAKYDSIRELWTVDGLRGYGAARVKELERRLGKLEPDVAALQARIVGPVNERLDITNALQGRRAPIVTMQTPYKTDGRFYGPDGKPALFANDAFARSDKRIQAVLKLGMGVAETPKMPTADGQFGDILVLGDRRAGKYAKEWAAKHGETVIQQGRGLRSSFEAGNFEQDVVERTKTAIIAAAEHCREAFPGVAVTHSENAERVYAAFAKNPKVIAAPGGNKIEALHKIADWQERIRRQGREALFMENWETSPLLVPLRVYSRLLQFGVVPRAHAFPLHVGDLVEKDGAFSIESRSLADDIRVIADYIKAVDRAEEEAPYLVKGLLHTLALADIYYDADLNRAAGNGKPLIDVQTIPLDAKMELEKDRKAFMQLRGEIREILLGPQIQTLDLEDVSRDMARIDPTFWRRWMAMEGQRRAQPVEGPRPGRLTRIKGPDTGSPAP